MVPQDQVQKSKVSGKSSSSMGKRKSIDSSSMNESEAYILDDEGSPGDKAGDREPEVQQSKNVSRAAPSRPVGNKIAKENAKRLKSKEDSFRISAQAQKVMAETSMERLRVLEGQTFMNMLLLPTDGLDHETLEFLKTKKQDSMSRLKARMTVQPSTPSASMPSTSSPPDPWPPRASRSHLPFPIEDASSPDDEQEDQEEASSP